MRLLWHLHGLPPYHNAGAELYALEVLRWFRARGHELEVLLRPMAPHDGNLEGIRITNRSVPRWDARLYETFDVILTHLDETPHAVRLAELAGKPLVHVLHNDRQLAFHRVKDAPLAIANSSWVASSVPDTIPTLTVWPPCPPANYAVNPGGDAVVLVNPSVAKGAPLAFELARRLPDVRFVVVGGGYGIQLKPPVLPNLELWRNHHDPRVFYRAARLVIVPSVYESFGRVPLEAAASGIPAIVRPTPGLREALAGGTTYAGRELPPDVFHRDDADELTELQLAEADEWVAAITGLLDSPAAYADASARARARALEAEAQTELQLVALEAALAALA